MKLSACPNCKSPHYALCDEYNAKTKSFQPGKVHRCIECKALWLEDNGWISKSPMLDGSGFYQYNGVTYKIVVQDLISTKHTVAFLDKTEVARASKFTTLLRKLDKVKQHAE